MSWSRVIYDEYGVDSTEIYRWDLDLQLEKINTKNNSFDYPQKNDFSYMKIKSRFLIMFLWIPFRWQSSLWFDIEFEKIFEVKIFAKYFLYYIASRSSQIIANLHIVLSHVNDWKQVVVFNHYSFSIIYLI